MTKKANISKTKEKLTDKDSKKDLKVVKFHKNEIKVKNVTIRDVDKELYENFMNLSKFWKKPSGAIFSRLFHSYISRRPSTFIPPRLKKVLKNLHADKLEVIENLDELEITKDDLASIDDGIKFQFSNINDLKFADDVDSDLFIDKIYRITHSRITNLPENIPKLLFYSIVREDNFSEKNNNKKSLKRELKEVTIRNVEESVYDGFTNICSAQNKKIGEVVNKILSYFIVEFELSHILLHEVPNPLNTLSISSVDHLSVSEKDLLDLAENKIIFHRIHKLELDDDISKESFRDKIFAIYNSNSNKPKNVNKLLYLARVKKYPA